MTAVGPVLAVGVLSVGPLSDAVSSQNVLQVGGLQMEGCQPLEITAMAFDCCEIVSRIFHGENTTPLRVRGATQIYFSTPIA